MLVELKRWRVASNAPFNCGPSDARAAPALAAARVIRAWATRKLGEPATAWSIREVSALSPKPCHQSAATTSLPGVAETPTLAGSTRLELDTMPEGLAQPASAMTMVEVKAMTM